MLHKPDNLTCYQQVEVIGGADAGGEAALDTEGLMTLAVGIAQLQPVAAAASRSVHGTVAVIGILLPVAVAPDEEGLLAAVGGFGDHAPAFQFALRQQGGIGVAIGGALPGGAEEFGLGAVAAHRGGQHQRGCVGDWGNVDGKRCSSAS